MNGAGIMTTAMKPIRLFPANSQSGEHLQAGKGQDSTSSRADERTSNQSVERVEREDIDQIQH